MANPFDVQSLMVRRLAEVGGFALGGVALGALLAARHRGLGAFLGGALGLAGGLGFVALTGIPNTIGSDSTPPAPAPTEGGSSG